jgi:hypothetical protein
MKLLAKVALKHSIYIAQLPNLCTNRESQRLSLQGSASVGGKVVIISETGFGATRLL